MDKKHLLEKGVLVNDNKLPYDGLPFINSKTTLRHFIGLAHKVLDDNPLKPFTVTIEFKNIAGEQLSYDSDLDISYLEKIVLVGGDASEVQITNELKKISKSLDKISNKNPATIKLQG